MVSSSVLTAMTRATEGQAEISNKNLNVCTVIEGEMLHQVGHTIVVGERVRSSSATRREAAINKRALCKAGVS